MAFSLPPAPRRYRQDNENQARRIVEQAFEEIFARLVKLEADVAAGGTPGAGAPTAGFSFVSNGLTVTFTDASTEGVGAVAAWAWSFGDGNTSTQQSPQHSYAAAGDYSVTLTVTDADGQQDTAQQTVTVAATVGPTANFIFSEDFLVVSFTDTSLPGDAAITARDWVYGDGTSSTVPNNPSPTHTYPDSGDYSVTLTVTDANGLQDSVTKSLTVVEDSPTNPAGAPTFLSWGTEIRDMPAAYNWWNGKQAAGMTENNCTAMLDAYADAGEKCFVRLWRTNFVVDANGNFQISLWKQEVDRYANDPAARAAIIQRSQDGTIICHMLADDILSERLWGSTAPLQGALLDEMASYSRQKFPDLLTIVRARFSQIGNFAFQHLQGVNAQYLFGRGGVAQGGMTQSQWRTADATAYADQELADRAGLPNNAGANMVLQFGLNVVNGGDTTSGIPGDGSPPGKFYMGANELTDYADVLVPRTTGLFSTWERGSDGSSDFYYNRSDVQASMNAIRSLCDAQGV